MLTSIFTRLFGEPQDRNSSIHGQINPSQLTLIRTNVIMSPGFRRWRKHITSQLKKSIS